MELRTILNNIREGLRSAKGRNVLTFFVFLLISTVFWFLLALNDYVQKDYAVPVQIENFPSEATILSGQNPVLSITVKDKGSDLMKFSWGNNPSMKLNFADFAQPNDSTLLLSPAKLNSAVRGIFGTGATIVATRPDSLKLIYTTQPGVKVALNVLSDIHTQPQYVYAGHPVTDVDSVMLYANTPDLYKIRSLSTAEVALANLADSVTMKVNVAVPKGMRAIPSSVTVTFPVEPLVAKKISVPIHAINVPIGVRLITFPSMTEVSYLLPKSMYGSVPPDLKATVDFNEITSVSTTLSVNLQKLPDLYRSVSLNPAEVEFVVEHAN